jgi:hypothetical protein
VTIDYRRWLEDSVEYSVSRALRGTTRSSVRYPVWFRVRTHTWVPVEASVLYTVQYPVVGSLRDSILASIVRPLP